MLVGFKGLGQRKDMKSAQLHKKSIPVTIINQGFHLSLVNGIYHHRQMDAFTYIYLAG